MRLKRLSQHLVRNKAVGDRSNPSGMRTVQATTGHQKVDMGRKLLIPAKGMDDRHNPRQIVFGAVPILKGLVGGLKKHLKVAAFANSEVVPEF